MPQPYRHSAHEALELEFYIPVAVWKHPATERFLSMVYSLVEGATVLGGAKGVWRGETESTNLVRVAVRETDVQPQEMIASVRKGIDELMSAWDASPHHRQEAFMFTVRRLTVYNTARPSA